MNLLAWAILGIIAGAIAKAIYPGRQGGGILATMGLGIVGSFVGGFLYTLLKTGEFALTSTGFSFGGIVVSIIGAIVTLFIYYSVTKRTA